MSARLPLQSKAFRAKFQNKKAIFADDDDNEEKINDERVLGFEDNKVKEAEPKKEAAPLSISPLPNADWRANAKHKKELYVPARALQPSDGSIPPEVLAQSTSSFGLQIQKREKTEIVSEPGVVESTTVDAAAVLPETIETEVPKTLEERAIEAIIKESMGEGDDDKNNEPKKVIHVDETLAFRDDIENRPEETTMEEYDKIPVDEFGAALLRGLGWSEGEGIGRNRKNAPAPPPAPIKQREALLGLGAKPEEIDLKGQRQKSHHRREAYEYKESSLFKKISKRKVEEALDEDEDRHRSRSRSSSSSRYSSGRHDKRNRHDDDRSGRRDDGRRSRRDDDRRSKYDDDRRSRRDDDRRSRRDDDRRSRRDDDSSSRHDSSSSRYRSSSGHSNSSSDRHRNNSSR